MIHFCSHGLFIYVINNYAYNHITLGLNKLNEIQVQGHRILK